MLAAFLGVAMVLGISTTTAIAAPTTVRQQMHTTSIHMDVANSNEPRDPSEPTAPNEEYQQTSAGKPTTRSPDSDPEPESIGGGSEP